MLKGTILGAAAAVALAAGGATGQTNLVTNPSFEQDDPSGATAPLGWLDFNQSSTASTLYAHSGTRSLRMVFGSSNFAGATTKALILTNTHD